MEKQLPLFPLSVVLFPDSALPLHIFEERYRALIGECLEAEGKEFGINFVDGDKLSLIGCTAVVREVVQRYEDGRLDIVVEGRRRYELRGVDKDVAPYSVGQVAFLEDEPEKIDSPLAKKTIELFNQLVEVVYKDRRPKPSVDPDVPCVSFVIAQKAGMDVKQRQELLEMKSENQRMQRLYSYLVAAIPKLQQAQEVQRIVINDGYIINS